MIEDKKQYLKDKFAEVMKNHLCGNYISIDENIDVEWYTNYDTESFIALTEYGTYTHKYDWDFSYDSNLEAFIEDLFQFIANNREVE